MRFLRRHGGGGAGRRGTYRCTAFTLIELLVVMAILTVLLTLVQASLDVARESARRAVCASNLRQLSIGYLVYAAENRGWLPEQYLTCHDQYHHFATQHRVLVPHMLPSRLDGADRLWEFLQAGGFGITDDTVQCPSRPVFFQNAESSSAMSWAGGVVTSYTYCYGLRPHKAVSAWAPSFPASVPGSPMRLTDPPEFVLIADTVAGDFCAYGYPDGTAQPTTANHRVVQYSGQFTGAWHLALGGSVAWKGRECYPARFFTGIAGSPCHGGTGNAVVCHSSCPWDLSWWWIRN